MRQIINFNSKWAFTKNSENIPDKVPKLWDFVNLPHTWNNIDGQDGNNDYYRGKCFYAKEFKKTDLPRSERYFLEINGANSSAEVFLNGKQIASHDGGYSSWRVDMSEQISEEIFIVITVYNSPNDHVYPHMADFTFYGGLYRDVNIICVSESNFELDYYGGSGIKITPTVIGKNA
ncbi:MAG: glycoside hydrolase family 2 protein, partial [Clostridia bacterium]|nr:glycoside hydrolase family 2 protein [Clostridia bacterium]